MLKRVFYWNRPIFKRLVPLNIKKLDLAIASARHFAMSDSQPQKTTEASSQPEETKELKMTTVAATPETIDKISLIDQDLPLYSYPGRVRLRALYEYQQHFIDKEIKVCGWAKTLRQGGGGSFAFLELADGSGVRTLQVVIDKAIPNFEEVLKNGVDASFQFIGTLVKSIGSKQPIELQVRDPEKHTMIMYGACKQGDYPLAGKKHHSVEFLRSVAHLRSRTRLIGCVARVRNALAYAVHQYFQQKGFLYVHTPLITASDCEGAGEMFQVTTVVEQGYDKIPLKKDTKEGQPKEIDYHKDFFGSPAFLTVSGQLSVETYCCGLSDVYTFGPTFRAENSHTSRHLAEFWMIEPEIAFGDIYDDMKLAEGLIKYCLSYILRYNYEDLKFFDEFVEKGLIARLENVVNEDFKVITYTEAVDLLQEEAKKVGQTKIGLFLEKEEEKQGQEPETKEGEAAPAEGEGEEKAGEQGEAKKKKKKEKKKKKKENVLFETGVPAWGDDLQSEHERYLTEKLFKRPVVVHAYPAAIKAFYMRLNDDGKTVAAMDILLPKVGELVGGSQREERLKNLDEKLEQTGLPKENYWWYRALREYGSIPHSGFGLGFERLVMTATGVENIRDVIPFPRVPGHAQF